METARKAKVRQMEGKLITAVDYAVSLRPSSEPDQMEACEKAIRFANMLSAAIVALKTEA